MSRPADLEIVADHAREAIREWRSRVEAPGVAVALVSTDDDPLVLVDGLASVRDDIEVRPDHRFHFGSITKSFTSMAAFRLAEHHEFDLAARIDAYLPWFEIRSAFPPIRVEHLLTHQAGLPIGADLGDTTDLDIWLLRTLDAAWAPGKGYAYSNAGYNAVGAAMAAATHRPFGDLLRELILDPIGMTSTAPAIDAATRPAEAVGYRRRVEADLSLGAVGEAPWVCITSASGAGVGTAGDLGRYLRTLLARGTTPGGRELLGASSFATMVSPKARIDERRWYAFGLRTYELDGRSVIEHGGEMLGMRASLVGDLGAGVGAIALVNLVDSTPLVLTEHLLRCLRAARAGTPLPSFDGPAERWVLRRPDRNPEEVPDDLRPWFGRYASTSHWRRPLAIVPGEERAIVRVAGVSDEDLFPVGDGRFRVGSARGPEEIAFDAVVDGHALRLSMSGHPYLRETSFGVRP